MITLDNLYSGKFCCLLHPLQSVDVKTIYVSLCFYLESFSNDSSAKLTILISLHIFIVKFLHKFTFHTIDDIVWD